MIQIFHLKVVRNIIVQKDSFLSPARPPIMVTASDKTSVDVILSCLRTSRSISRTRPCHWSFLRRCNQERGVDEDQFFSPIWAFFLSFTAGSSTIPSTSSMVTFFLNFNSTPSPVGIHSIISPGPT